MSVTSRGQASKMAARWTSSSSTITSSSGKSENFQHTKLDETIESLSLLSILRAFDSPVTEERAWAILHQSAKTALQCFTSANRHQKNNNNNLTDNSDQVKCAVVGETSQLWIHRDGHVHPHSFQVAADSIEGSSPKKSPMSKRGKLFDRFFRLNAYLSFFFWFWFFFFYGSHSKNILPPFGSFCLVYTTNDVPAERRTEADCQSQVSPLSASLLLFSLSDIPPRYMQMSQQHHCRRHCVGLGVGCHFFCHWRNKIRKRLVER